MKQQKIVVLHGLRDDSRPTTINHTLCFARHLNGVDILYVNIFGKMPVIEKIDLLVVTYELVALRNLPIWRELVKRIEPLLVSSHYKIVMPQDDYSRSDVLDQFVAQNNFDAVFTPITRNLEVLYPQSTVNGVLFQEAFTGYFEEHDWENVQCFSRPFNERQIDVGQRVRHLPPQLGAEAGMKGKLALEFGLLATQQGFKCDVSTKAEDVLLGNDWWESLGNIRFTVSRRGGASIADPNGRLADRVRRYQLRHPRATMEQIGNHVSLRGGREGDFSAISPRLFEAAALGVCQILVSDFYVEGLLPGVHYIELMPDMSNIDEVFRIMQNESRCKEIIDASQEILLKSKKFNYQSLVNAMAQTAGIEIDKNRPSTVQDSSSVVDSFIGKDQFTLSNVQDYVRRAFVSGKIKKAIQGIEDGVFLPLKPSDSAWGPTNLEELESLRFWLSEFRNKGLIVESLAIPWRTATSFLNSSQS